VGVACRGFGSHPSRTKRRKIVKPLLTVGLTLVILLAFASAASAGILRLDVRPVEPRAGEAVTFTVKGEQPTPCYKQAIAAERTYVDDRVIHLAFDVEPTTVHLCPTVIDDYEVEFEFPDGFAAGSYEIRVTERLYDHTGKYAESSRTYLFVINRTAAGVPNETSGWGAVKALYGPDVD
jgi:hypothetical protein